MFASLSTVWLLLTINGLFSLAVILSVILLFYKVGEVHKQTKGFHSSDRKTNKRIAEKFEEEAHERLDRLMRVITGQLEEEIKRQIAKVAETASLKAQEMAQFTKEQEEAIFKESQLMVANIVMKAEKQAEEYRRSQIEKLAGQINAIVSAAAREVLGRTISIGEHEDLVKQALERAKKDKFFT